MKMFLWAVDQVVVMIVDEPSGSLIHKEQITCNLKKILYLKLLMR